MEKNNINFSDVFDIDQSENTNANRNKNNFFSNKQLKALPDSKKN